MHEMSAHIITSYQTPQSLVAAYHNHKCTLFTHTPRCLITLQCNSFHVDIVKTTLCAPLRNECKVRQRELCFYAAQLITSVHSLFLFLAPVRLLTHTRRSSPAMARQFRVGVLALTRTRKISDLIQRSHAHERTRA